MYQLKQSFIAFIVLICIITFTVCDEIIIENYKTYSGKEFNQWAELNGKVFVKILNKAEIHFDFHYFDGENIDIIEFNPTGSCQAGGLYFCEFQNFFFFNNWESYYMRQVIVPDDALVYVDNHKFKANKIHLDKRYTIEQHPLWKYRKDDVKRLIKFMPYYFTIIEEQTPEIILEAVKQNGLDLEYVINQTFELCLEAVKQNGMALQYVKLQTQELCMEAVKQNGMALQYVKLQTQELSMEAVKQNGYAIQYIKKQTDELCLEAVRKNGLALKFIEKQTEELAWIAIKNDCHSFKYIENQTVEMCLYAISKNKFNFYDIHFHLINFQICEYMNQNYKKSSAHCDTIIFYHKIKTFLIYYNIF